MMKNLWMLAALAASTLFFAACAGSRATARKDADVPVAKPSIPAPIETGRTIDGEPDVRDMNLRPIPGVKTIQFAYDSDTLDETARAALRANADLLKASPAMKVQVAGHCDQRGTTAYNLALGQRRAKTVKDYYKALGVDGDRIATISWGKEHLLCSEASDACWERNRRAETLEAVNANIAAP
jgi:peptidoglycan-associated lipoprotein